MESLFSLSGVHKPEDVVTDSSINFFICNSVRVNDKYKLSFTLMPPWVNTMSDSIIFFLCSLASLGLVYPYGQQM